MKDKEPGRKPPERAGHKRRARVRPDSGERRKPAEDAVVRLQQTVGNQAVLAFLASAAARSRLQVSKPGDASERDAERVAGQAQPSAGETSRRGAELPGSRPEQPRPPAGDQGSARDALIGSLGPGRPLDPIARETMEARLDADLGDVRIHTGADAASAADRLDARAFTAGQHIAFGAGQYAPHSPAGDRLLAHELTHTLQSRDPGANLPAVQRDSLAGKASAWFSEKTGDAGKWVDEKKWAAYRAMIAALKSGKNAGIAEMRGMVGRLPGPIQGAASAIIDVLDFFQDMVIALLLAIVGLAVGFVEGIVGLVTGLIKLALGLLKMAVDYLVSLMGRPEEYQEDVKALAAAVRNIPPGLAKMKDEWVERYRHATLEEQVLMGGELVGQIEAFIATFAFAGAKAGQGGSLAARGGDIAVSAVGKGGAAVAERVPAMAIAVPAVVPKTAAEAAVVSTQMLMMSAPGPGPAGAAGSGGSGDKAPLRDATDEELDQAIGNMKPAGTPQKFQPHAGATRNRQALGVSGKDVQSGHLAPQSVMKPVPGYNPGQALTKLLDKAVHTGMDQYWKETFQAMRAAGRTEATAQEIHDVVAESIRRAPGLAPGDKSSLIARLTDEMFVEFGLRPGDMLDLPYPNLSPP
jgi:hypothetical protein